MGDALSDAGEPEANAHHCRARSLLSMEVCKLWVIAVSKSDESLVETGSSRTTSTSFSRVLALSSRTRRQPSMAACKCGTSSPP